MINKIFYFIFTLLFCAIHANGQNLDGYVYDKTDSTAIENVLVRIDNNNQLFALTDANGYFKFEKVQKLNNVHLYFSHMSYKTQVSTINNSTAKIYLEPTSHNINEVVVKSDWIYRRDGNVIVDFSQMPMEQNMQLSDALKHVPGVVKNSKGSFSLNGKSADIYINNIKQNITANSLEAFLSSLPSTMVSNIELISVNSGKYSASTDAIININTKTNIALGTSIQPYLFTSVFPHGWYDMGGNLFYMEKKGKWLYNSTLSYSNERYYQAQSDSLRYNSKLFLDDYNREDGRMNVITFRGSALREFANGSQLSLNSYIYYDRGNTDKCWSNLGFENNGDKRAHSDLYNASLSYILPKQNQLLNGNISYSFSYGNDNSYTNYKTIDHVTYKQADLRLRGYMNTVNVDLNTKINSFLLSYGTQLDYNRVTNKTEYIFNKNLDNTNDDFSAHEMLSALYSQIKYKFSDNVSSRLGARIEHTDYSYNIEGNRQNKNYTNIFPSFLTYFDCNNYYSTIGIISNINRPKYEWMVSGEKQYNDAVSVFGNKDLKPTKLYGFVFYNTFFKYLNINLSYTLIHDYIGSLLKSNGQHLNSTYQNIGDKNRFNTYLVLPFQFYKKQFSGQLQVNLSYDKLHNFKNDFTLPINRQTAYWNVSTNANITYTPTQRLGVSIDGRYSPHYDTPLQHTDSNGSFDIELQYNMLKAKDLLLTLSASDLMLKDVKTTSYFDDSKYYTQKASLGPVFLVSLKLKLNKGQRVVEEYKDYTPDSSRLK